MCDLVQFSTIGIPYDKWLYILYAYIAKCADIINLSYKANAYSTSNGILLVFQNQTQGNGSLGIR